MRNATGRRWILTGLLLAAGPALAAGVDIGGKGNGFHFALAVGIGITAFVAWGRAAFPELARRSERAVADSSPAKCFGVGLANFAVAAVVAVSLMKSGNALGPAAPLGLLALSLLVAVTAFRGALGVWPSYGHLILGPDSAATSLQATLAGGALLTGMLFFFPLGTFFFLYAALRAVGTSVLLWTRTPPTAAAKA